MICAVENSQFTSLGVDLTQRCNMSCNFCYSAEWKGHDLDLAYFEEVCRRLPSKVLWKFAGGEPTLHPQFFDLLKVAHLHGHGVHVSSNGMKYLEPEFAKQAARASLKFRSWFGLTLDGGLNDDYYLRINGQSCAEQKLAALSSLLYAGVKTITISAIIVRGINEAIVPQLLRLADDHREIHFIHFRTVARTGRYLETKPYDLMGLKDLVRPFFKEDQFQSQYTTEGLTSTVQLCWQNKDAGNAAKQCSKLGCCYRFVPRAGLQVSLIEFATDRAASCPQRGKLLEGFRVTGAFSWSKC